MHSTVQLTSHIITRNASSVTVMSQKENAQRCLHNGCQILVNITYTLFRLMCYRGLQSVHAFRALDRCHPQTTSPGYQGDWVGIQSDHVVQHATMNLEHPNDLAHSAMMHTCRRVIHALLLAFSLSSYHDSTYLLPVLYNKTDSTSVKLQRFKF